jgi:hypothetical protein
MVGIEFTLMVMVSEATQPVPLSASTVYVVVAVGVTTVVEPVIAPGFHV